MLESQLDKVAVSAKSPQPLNTSVTVSANTAVGTNPQFKYSVHDGAKWHDIKNYSSSQSVTWKPAKAGTYKVRVQVKSKNSKKAFDNEKVLNYTVFSPAKVNAFKANLVSPQPSKTAITLEATAVDKVDNLYKFSVHNGEKWIAIRDYSASNKVNWKPDKEGTYRVKVDVKHKLSTKSSDAAQEITYVAYDKAVIQPELQEEETETERKVLVTATKTSHPQHLYQFSVHDGTEWKVVQAYSSAATYQMLPEQDKAYQFKIEAKHRLSPAPHDASQELVWGQTPTTVKQ